MPPFVGARRRRVFKSCDTAGRRPSFPSRLTVGPRRGGGSPTPAVPRPTLRLRGAGHQLEAFALESLAFLRAARDRREDDPRTALRLALGADPDQSMALQCGLFPRDDAGLQFGTLVQASVPGQRVCQRHSRNRAPGFPGGAWKADPSWRASRPPVASGLPAQKAVPRCGAAIAAAASTKKVNL